MLAPLRLPGPETRDAADDMAASNSPVQPIRVFGEMLWTDGSRAQPAFLRNAEGRLLFSLNLAPANSLADSPAGSGNERRASPLWDHFPEAENLFGGRASPPCARRYHEDGAASPAHSRHSSLSFEVGEVFDSSCSSSSTSSESDADPPCHSSISSEDDAEPPRRDAVDFELFDTRPRKLYRIKSERNRPIALRCIALAVTILALSYFHQVHGLAAAFCEMAKDGGEFTRLYLIQLANASAAAARDNPYVFALWLSLVGLTVLNSIALRMLLKEGAPPPRPGRR